MAAASRWPAVAADVLVDTGVLVAVLDRKDPAHPKATGWLERCSARLHTVAPVLAETAFFLPVAQRAALTELAARGTLQLHHPDSEGLRRVASLLRKYADLDPDWSDACLVWAAESRGIQHIATLDVRDFSTYRIHGRTKFVLEPIA